MQEPVRQMIRSPVALPIGQLDLLNAGSTGADEYTDTVGAELRTTFLDLASKSILRQRQPCQPVVAAVPAGQFANQGGVNAVDLTD
jgi:hypothetical protein